ncbi:MAG: hypothetical protein J5992_00210 [Oscillospiraceae bacterium]|nr:hypothetical protein [Oscillospiraceae bacterium]
MDKTKFGITVGALSAIGYLCGYLGMTPMIIFFVFTLALSAERVIKVNALQSMLLSFVFVLVKIVMGWLISLNGNIVELAYKINSTVGEIFSAISKFTHGVNGFFDIVETVIFMILIFMAFSGKIVKLPVISKIAEKHIAE